MKRKLFAILSVGLLAVALTGAQAMPMFFTNEAAFHSSASAVRLGSLSFEGFESLANLTPAPFTLGNLTVSPGAGNLATIFTPSDLATEGTHILGWNNGSASLKTITFVFAEPINAFGIRHETRMNSAGIKYSGWNGLLAPNGTPRAIVRKLYDVMVQSMNSSDVRTDFERQARGAIEDRRGIPRVRGSRAKAKRQAAGLKAE